MAKVGRPTLYTKELGEEICRRYAAGEPLSRICQADDMPSINAVYDWRDLHEEFRALLSCAQERFADSIADQTLDIVDNDHDPQRARNRANYRQWLAGKMNRPKYGEKVDINHKTEITVTLAIDEALNRVRSVSDQRTMPVLQDIETEYELVPTSHDEQSQDDDIFS